MWWSIAPDLSWAAFDRLLAYCAFALLGLLACRVERPARTVAAGLAVLVGLVLAWALLGKVIPSLFPDGARVARLRNPVGYWNSLALVAATAMPLGLWGASRRHPREARAAGAVLVYLAELVAVLTYSRAGIAVAALAALAWVAFTRDRLEALLTLVLVTPVAALVALWAFSRPALTDDLQTYADRVNDGAWFGVLAVAGLALVGIGAWLTAGVELSEEDRRVHTRRLGAIVGIGAVAALVLVLALKGGAILDEFRGSKAQVTQSPNRLGDLSSSNRWTWWKESWQLWQEAPVGGKGAGTFEIARRQHPGRLDRHHRAARPAAPVPGRDRDRRLPAAPRPDRCRRDRRRLRGAEGRGARARRGRRARDRARRICAALAGRDPLGVRRRHGARVLRRSGCSSALGARRSVRPPRAVPVAATVVAAGALYSLTAPYASSRLVDSAYEGIDRGDVPAAVSDARAARWLNPLSTDPLLALGDAESARQDEAAGLAAYREAVRLQPENSSTWYALGSFEFFTGRYRDALHDLDRAYGLDPYGPAGRPGGLLDQARAKVEGR